MKAYRFVMKNVMPVKTKTRQIEIIYVPNQGIFDFFCIGPSYKEGTAQNVQVLKDMVAAKIADYLGETDLPDEDIIAAASAGKYLNEHQSSIDRNGYAKSLENLEKILSEKQ